MRKMLIISVILILVVGCANIKNNPLASEDQKKNEFVVDYKGMDKGQLFSKVLEAMALVYKSSKEVVEMQDREGGNIVGNGYTEIKTDCKGGVYSELPFGVSYTIHITVKDEKVRYRYLPRMEKFGIMTAEDSKHLSQENRDYIENMECYWTVLSAYFQKVTDLMSVNISKKDDF